MVERFFSATDQLELRKAVLIMASHAKGGIGEWLEMGSNEFMEWLEALKDLQRDGGK